MALISHLLRKYAAISSSEQRQSYKNDFNAEYSEYRDLHARIEQITRRFTQLDAQLRQLSQGSEEYEVELPPPSSPPRSPCRASALELGTQGLQSLVLRAPHTASARSWSAHPRGCVTGSPACRPPVQGKTAR